MKNRPDARKLDIATQTHLRRTVVQAVRGGMSQTEASKVYGVSLRAVSKWMALDRAGDLRALKPKRRGRRAGEGRLTPVQSARIRQLIIDSLPDQMKLPFYLWTRAAVVALIEHEYGISVSLTTVGRYLSGWGMSPQKPVRRAYERDDAAIARRLRTEYPAIARDAKREKAVIYWGDEMGLRSDHVAGTSYAPLGQTPIIRATGQRFGCNMISAITNRGYLAFMVFHGKFDGRLFVRFMQRLLKQAAGALYLIVDGPSGAPVHKRIQPAVGRIRLQPLAHQRLQAVEGFPHVAGLPVQMHPDPPFGEEHQPRTTCSTTPPPRSSRISYRDALP